MQSEVDLHIQRIETPFGGEPHLHASEASRQWLIAHEEEAFPRLLTRAAELASPAIYEMLAEFGREEALPLLARALEEGGPNADSAARSLARHPQARAGEILSAALASPDQEVDVAAADALLLRGDRGNCEALMTKLAAPDALVRYHVVQAAGHLGCIGPQILQSLAERDDNEDIRNLAAALLKERGD